VSGGDAHNAAPAAEVTDRPVPTTTDAPINATASALRRRPDLRRVKAGEVGFSTIQ